MGVGLGTRLLKKDGKSLRLHLRDSPIGPDESVSSPGGDLQRGVVVKSLASSRDGKFLHFDVRLIIQQRFCLLLVSRLRNLVEISGAAG